MVYQDIFVFIPEKWIWMPSEFEYHIFRGEKQHSEIIECPLNLNTYSKICETKCLKIDF